MKQKLELVENTLLESVQTLVCFKAILNLDEQYFCDQWSRHREVQTEYIEDQNHQEVQELLGRLGEYKDEQISAK